MEHISSSEVKDKIIMIIVVYCVKRILIERAEIRGENALRALAYQGRIELAFDYATRRSNLYERFSGFLTICEVAGRDVLRERLEEINEIADLIPDVQERSEAYLRIASVLAMFGLNEQSNDFLEKAANTSLISPDYERKLSAIDGLSQVLLTVGQFSKSEKLREHKGKTERKGDLFLQKSTIDYAQQGLFKEAVEYLSKIQTADVRFETSQELGRIMATSGSIAQALSLLQFRSLDDLLNTLTSWHLIFEREERGLSFRIMCEAIRIIGWIREDWHDIYTLLEDK